MRTKLLIALGIAGLALLAWLAISSQRSLDAALPPRTECRDALDARTQAEAFAREHGGELVPVLGTGSMAPFIPAAPAGADPLRTIVALVVTVPGATYADIGAEGKGSLVLYAPAWAPPGGRTMHLAATRDGAGWIVTGLHNRDYENATRVTPANFIALAGHVFTWPLSPGSQL